MDKKEIKKLKREKANAILPSLTSKDFFESKFFQKKVEKTIRQVIPGRKIEVELFHSTENEVSAYTNGTRIVENTGNDIIMFFSTIYDQYEAAMGCLYHELAHVRFSDFKMINDLLTGINEGQILWLEDLLQKTESELEKEILADLREIARSSKNCKILKKIYGDVLNRILDQHDEECLIACSGPKVQFSLEKIREALRSTILPYEEMEDMAITSRIYSAVLQYARFEEVYFYNSPVKLPSEIEDFFLIASDIIMAKTLDDSFEMLRYVHRIVHYVWKRLDDGSKSHSELLAELEEGQKRSGGTTPPVNVPQNETDNSGDGDNTLADMVSDAEKDTEAEIEEEVKRILQKIAEEIAGTEVEDMYKKREAKKLRITEQNPNNVNVTIDVINKFKVSNYDVSRYKAMAQELYPVSRRLAKKLENYLQEMQDHAILHKCHFGRYFEASNAYRPDQRFYGRRKMPDDLLDIAICVLVDQSGSMSADNRYQAAQRATIVLENFSSLLGIPIAIFGHCSIHNTVRFYQYVSFDRFKPTDKYQLSKIEPWGNNRDGAAIEIALQALAERPENRKLAFIISDGLPNADGYSGEFARDDIQEVIKRYKRKRIDIVAAAIGEDKDNIKEIYGTESYLNISDVHQLPKRLLNILMKKIIA